MTRADSYAEDKQAVLHRRGLIEGQARRRLRVADDRYCIDILQQIASMQPAADTVAMILLEDHVKECVADGLRSGSDGRVDEVVDVIRRFLKR